MRRERNEEPRKRRKWKPKGAFNMQQLPLAIMMDILLKLSIKTLCNFRCVCKDWLRMISDPKFAYLHHLRSPPSILVKTLPPRMAQSRLDLIHVEKSYGYSLQSERMRFAPQNSIPCSLSHMDLLNSYHGFVCLWEPMRDGSLYVCNPVLGEYISIPSPGKNRIYLQNITGIGFSTKTKEYKVMQSYHNYSDKLDAKIYTINGTGVWRSIGNPPTIVVAKLPFNSYIHGALHWIAESFSSPKSAWIQSFDFETEEFRALPPPESLQEAMVKIFGNCSLGVSNNGCLFLGVYGDAKFDMWIMKDYGARSLGPEWL